MPKVACYLQLLTVSRPVCCLFLLQHLVFLVPDGAAECVCALPVWRGQRHPVSGTGLLVWHCDWSQYAAIQVIYTYICFVGFSLITLFGVLRVLWGVISSYIINCNTLYDQIVFIFLSSFLFVSPQAVQSLSLLPCIWTWTLPISTQSSAWQRWDIFCHNITNCKQTCSWQ